MILTNNTVHKAYLFVFYILNTENIRLSQSKHKEERILVLFFDV